MTTPHSHLLPTVFFQCANGVPYRNRAALHVSLTTVAIMVAGLSRRWDEIFSKFSLVEIPISLAALPQWIRGQRVTCMIDLEASDVS